MNVRDIVRKAWQVTQVHLKKLIWYGAVPAFFGTLVSSAYIAYQYNNIKSSELFSDGGQVNLLQDIKMVWSLVTAHPQFTIAIVIIGIIVVLGYILTPPIFTGTLIRALMNIKNFKPIAGSLEIGIRRFFPMFEFGLITGSFSIVTIFTESAFILRWWGQSALLIALPILLFIATVGLIISFLFTYSEYFIVLKGYRVIESMKESAILVLANLRKTFLIFILVILIGVRAILNVLLILLIPLGVVIIMSFLATTFLHLIGIIISVIFGIGILLVSSYLMGLFGVFSTAVWVLTFAALTEKSQDQAKDTDIGGGKFPEPEGVK